MILNEIWKLDTKSISIFKKIIENHEEIRVIATSQKIEDFLKIFEDNINIDLHKIEIINLNKIIVEPN